MRMPYFSEGVRVAIDDMQKHGDDRYSKKSFTKGVNACGRPGLFCPWPSI